MKQKVCCFTGHRDLPENQYNIIKTLCRHEIEDLIKKGIDTFICGGAIGFDMLCAELVCEFKSVYDIKLVLAIQDRFFSDADKKYYKTLLEKADEITYTSESYFRGCMQKRNRYMVDNSSHIISYCTKNIGGSHYTKEYAQKNNLEIIEISDCI